MQLEGLAEKTAPSSTAVGAVIANAVVARSIERILEARVAPPVFISANIEGGDEHNRRIMEQYKDNIFYM